MTGQFPQTRLRRNRQDHWRRELLAETQLLASDLVWPLFVQDGDNTTPIDSLPGVSRHSIASLVEQAQQAVKLGIPAIALFPYVDISHKDDTGSEAWNPDNLICRAIAAVKQSVPDIGIIADVALDPYTTHGHDGIVLAGDVDNDQTVTCLLQQALTLAEAGADYVAPSDMMDGRIGAIRTHLDREGHQKTGIISYAAKYASAFYGPFRDAVGSAAALGPQRKKTYQMDYRNSNEALREVEQDITEGADAIIVKPAMSYLDIVQRISTSYNIPVMAYHVSGEYAMVKAAAATGSLNAAACLIEQLTACKRAGACAIWSYAAPDIAQLLKDH